MTDYIADWMKRRPAKQKNGGLEGAMDKFSPAGSFLYDRTGQSPAARGPLPEWAINTPTAAPSEAPMPANRGPLPEWAVEPQPNPSQAFLYDTPPASPEAAPAGPAANNFMLDRPLLAGTGVTTPVAAKGVFVGREPWRPAVPQSMEEAGAAGQRARDGRQAVTGWNAMVGSGAEADSQDRRVAGLARASQLAAPSAQDWEAYRRRVNDSEVRMGIRPPDDMDPREAFLRKQSQNGAVAPQYRAAAQQELGERQSAANSQMVAAQGDPEEWKVLSNGGVFNTRTKERVDPPVRPEKLAQNEKLYDPITQKLIAENMETVTKDGVKVKDLVELQRNVIFMTPQQKAAYEAMFNTVMAELKGKATPAAEVVPAGVTTPAPEKKPAATGGKMKSRDFDPNMD